MQWSHLNRIAFRWLFVYVVLFCLPVPPTLPRRWFVEWTGKLMGVDAAMRFTGKGDTAIHYIQALRIAVLAVAATLVWSLATAGARTIAVCTRDSACWFASDSEFR